MEAFKIESNKKALSLLLSCVILMLMLPAVCSANSLITEKKVFLYNDTLEGESENWKAKYLLNETHVFITADRKTHYFGKEESRLIMTYKCNLSGFSAPKQFEYSYEAGSRGGYGNATLDREDCNWVVKSRSEGGLVEEQKAVFEHTINSICTPYRTVYIHRRGGTELGEDGTVKVTLEMDGKKESLVLKRTG
jgi:hypothetical protein